MASCSLCFDQLWISVMGSLMQKEAPCMRGESYTYLWSKERPLKCNNKLYSLRIAAVVDFPLGSMAPPARELASLQYQAWTPLCWECLKSNYTAVGYPHDRNATITPFRTLAVLAIVVQAAWELIPREGCFRSDPAWLCLKYCSVWSNWDPPSTSGRQLKQWQWWIWFSKTPWLLCSTILKAVSHAWPQIVCYVVLCLLMGVLSLQVACLHIYNVCVYTHLNDILAILAWGTRHLKALLNFIFLTKHAEHFQRYPLPIFFSSFKNFMFRSVSHFLLRTFGWSKFVLGFLILGMRPLSAV